MENFNLPKIVVPVEIKKEEKEEEVEDYNYDYYIALYKMRKGLDKIFDKYLNSVSGDKRYKVKLIDELNNNKQAIRQPDVIIIGLKEQIDEDLINFCKKNKCQIMRYTSSPIDYENYKDQLVISTSQDIFFRENIYNKKIEIKTFLDEAISLIKDVAQMSNMSKLQQLSRELLRKDVKDEYKSEEEINDTLYKLNEFLRLKDDYTKYHSENVAYYAVLLGKQLGFEGHDLRTLKLGGELHDIGKVGIPTTIINKVGKLTEEEYEIMKNHTLIGYKLLPNNYDFKKIIDIVRSHHERIDGYGYPDGLKGDSIPLFAKIISVCDTFDAITTKRTYNKRKTLSEAFNELKKSALVGTGPGGRLVQQLDPHLVTAFIEAVREDQYTMEKFEKSDQEIFLERSREKIKRK